jgi:hypothetical protein
MRVSPWLRGVVAVLAGLVMAVMTAWAAGAIRHQTLTGNSPGHGVATHAPTGPVVDGAGAAR